MLTQFVNLKDWRQNMHQYWKKSQGKMIRFIVLKHSKPMFEVKTLDGNALPPESLPYKVLGKSFESWFSPEDDHIFDESVRL